jgi:outer membrane protein
MKLRTLITCMAGSLSLVSHALFAQNLVELYDVALNSDPQYQAARANKQSVQQLVSISESRLLPTIGFSANVNQVDKDVVASTGFDESYQAEDYTLSVNQPIYRRDRWLALDQSKEQSKKADIEFLAAEQDLIIRLSKAYFDVLAAKDTLDFVLADKKAISRQLDQAKQRFEVGLIAITDVHEAQAAYDQAIANEIEAVNRLDSTKEILREIVGDQMQDLDLLGPIPELLPPVPASLDSWTEEALQQNPLVQSALKTAEVARQEISVQKSGHYPSLDIVGSYSMSRSDANTAVETDVGVIGLQLAVPLYSGGGVVSATKKAHFDYDAALQVVEQQQRSVTRLVRDAYRGVMSSISRVKALEATRVSSKSALEATEAGFEVGTRTIVDVLNSQRNLYSTMNDYAQARYSYVINGLLLKQAAGTLSVDDLKMINQWLMKN